MNCSRGKSCEACSCLAQVLLPPARDNLCTRALWLFLLFVKISMLTANASCMILQYFNSEWPFVFSKPTLLAAPPTTLINTCILPCLPLPCIFSISTWTSHKTSMAIQRMHTFCPQFYIGWRFHVGAWKAIKRGGANMDVLVSLGTNASYIYSVSLSIICLARQHRSSCQAANEHMRWPQVGHHHNTDKHSFHRIQYWPVTPCWRRISGHHECVYTQNPHYK